MKTFFHNYKNYVIFNIKDPLYINKPSRDDFKIKKARKNILLIKYKSLLNSKKLELKKISYIILSH